MHAMREKEICKFIVKCWMLNSFKTYFIRQILYYAYYELFIEYKHRYSKGMSIKMQILFFFLFFNLRSLLKIENWVGFVLRKQPGLVVHHYNRYVENGIVMWSMLTEILTLTLIFLLEDRNKNKHYIKDLLNNTEQLKYWFQVHDLLRLA